MTGFAANYVLPGRAGELFRADYARRVFNMSGSVQSFSHIWFGLSGARHWLKR